MNERIKMIRQNANLNMASFAERIGITISAVSRIESGENNPKDQTVMLICREFNVNEEWLRTGKGEMYNLPTDEVAEVVSEFLSESNPLYDLVLDVLRAYQSADDKTQKALTAFIKRVYDERKKAK